MKLNIVKSGLMAAANLAAAFTIHAQLPVSQYKSGLDQLVLGFTIPPSTGDLVIDLGAASEVGVGGTTVVDLIANHNVGEGASALLAQLNSLYGSMSSLTWGVVGGHYKNSIDSAVYATVPHGTETPTFGPGGTMASAVDTVGDQIDGSGKLPNQQIVDPTQGYGVSWTEQINSATSIWQKYATDPDSTTSATFATGGVHYQLADLYLRTNAIGYPIEYKGYFTLGNDGSFTFTPATSAPPALPPAPVLALKRAGNASTISFGTTNGATYALFYTNVSGLTSPLSKWGVLPSTVTGNGQTNSFSDTTTDSSRVYRVAAH